MTFAPKTQTQETSLDWLPKGVSHYLAHTVGGQSIRSLARASGMHASTILRQVRRIEQRRDDPLVDLALKRLGPEFGPIQTLDNKDIQAMPSALHPDHDVLAPPSEEVIAREGRRILRRLSERGAVLAVAENMEKTVVVRDSVAGVTTRTGTVDREVAEAMALKDWIAVTAGAGKIARYQITAAGRAALKSLMAEAENRAAVGFAVAPTAFTGLQPVESASDLQEPRATRYTSTESPLVGLSRRRDKDGQAFLDEELVSVGERLREDFELAQMSEAPVTSWEEIVAGDGPTNTPTNDPGPEAARDRVAAALRDLGPGLGDVALRCGAVATWRARVG